MRFPVSFTPSLIGLSEFMEVPIENSRVFTKNQNIQRQMTISLSRVYIAAVDI